jgi:hypothetical protein
MRWCSLAFGSSPPCSKRAASPPFLVIPAKAGIPLFSFSPRQEEEAEEEAEEEEEKKKRDPRLRGGDDWIAAR